MARKPDVQYIRYMTDGSSARALQPVAIKPKTRLPKTILPKIRLPETPVIKLDPLASAGILVSVIMVILLVVNCVQLFAIQQEANALDDYVDCLKTENARLTAEYNSGYDLDDIREKALALGLVPVDQVQKITVNVPVPEGETSVEEQGVLTFLTGLFD